MSGRGHRAGRAASLLIAALLPGAVASAMAGAGMAGDELLRAAPAASVDLATRDGLSQVAGTWRYSDARLVEVSFPTAGPDGRPTGPPRTTHDIAPKAGVTGFDDSAWEVIPPETLSTRRSAGRVSFGWYRLKLTVPERIGAYRTAGSTIVFEIVVDDYAEVWVNGELARELGQIGGTVIGGFNRPNTVVVARDVRPGQQFHLAVFGINGPISEGPVNFIWVRSARLDFHPPHPAAPPMEVLRLDPAIDQVVPAGATVEKLADGFTFTEGPVWLPEGSLLFSEPDRNRIHRWTPGGVPSVFRSPSGYEGADIAAYRQPGSNGLTLDAEGRLVICEHGNRRVTRLEKDGRVTVLADRHEGRRLNSPNDLVYRSDGSLFFTDPPFGLPRVYDDPRKELPYSGVFRLSPDGSLTLLTAELAGPNGIALSPDERFLYVGNWDLARKVVMRYHLEPDGTLGAGLVFFDMTKEAGDQAIDGVKVDQRGNVYVSGPGGVWILSPEGKHLGTIRGPEPAHNFAWGDADGRTLYLTARTGLYRIRLGVSGVRPPGPPALAARQD